MFNRKFSSNIRRKKRMMTLTIILLVVFLSVGYSAFTTNLEIDGTLNVSKYSQTLYRVLQEEANTNGLAREYTGAHQDSMDASLSRKRIYHWYATNQTDGEAILNKNNVIFANHCWQVIRTTDTGGVRMIYNGEPENNQCLNTRGSHVGYASRTTQSMSTTYYYGTSYTYNKTNNVFSLDGTITTGTIKTRQYTCKQTTSTGTCATLYFVDTLSSGTTYYVLPLNSNSHYSQFGVVPFNSSSFSVDSVGYMNNSTYKAKSRNMTSSEEVLYDEYMIAEFDYFFGDGITYNDGVYTLTNPTQDTWANKYSTAAGLYVCVSDYATCDEAYYVVGATSEWLYGFKLTDGHLLNYYDTNIVLGTGYTENNGTYTLTNTTTINKSSWFSNYSTYSNYYTCGNANTSCTNLSYITGTSNIKYDYLSLNNNYIYANSFTYDGTNYKLDSTNRVQFWNMKDSTNKLSIRNNHYTCLTTSDTCETIKYINYLGNGSISIYYIELTGGESVEEALGKMLNANNVNVKDSVIKTTVDIWYKKYLLDYDNYLDDTIYCNDRSIYDLSGWNPNGGVLTSYLQFKPFDLNTPTADLSCTNETDRFSISNPKAQLTYKVALISYDEMLLFNNRYPLITGQNYFLITPWTFDADMSYVIIVGPTGYMNNYSRASGSPNGLRPTISLKPGIEYTTGDGSMTNPYVIE